MNCDQCGKPILANQAVCECGNRLFFEEGSDFETDSLNEDEVCYEDDPSHNVAYLVLKDSKGITDHKIAIMNDVIVGRSDSDTGQVDVDLNGLQNWEYVSRKHARIYHAEGRWFLLDLNSSNGTFVTSISSQKKTKVGTGDTVELFEGDELIFGNVEFVFELD